MRTTSAKLLEDLSFRTKENLAQAMELKNYSEAALQWKAGPKIWSALECVDHINQYAEIYIKNITQGIKKSDASPQASFVSKGLGNWFSNLMRPGDLGTKMKTFSSKNPNGSKIELSAIEIMIDDQHTFLNLLEQAADRNLKKTKVATDFGSWLSLNLGDSLRIIIYHNQRHLQQAKRSLEAASLVAPA